LSYTRIGSITYHARQAASTAMRRSELETAPDPQAVPRCP
jgi:hypothetical protein